MRMRIGSQTSRGGSRRTVAAACVAGFLCTAIAAYAPILAAWFRPSLVTPRQYRSISVDGRDFDVGQTIGVLRTLGYERVNITAMRNQYTLSPDSQSSEDSRIAAIVVEADEEILGPLPPVGPAMMDRDGLNVHLHAAGFPFKCVEARIAEVWRNAATVMTYEGLNGGSRLQAWNANAMGGWQLFIIPWGVQPLGLLGNLAVWSGLVWVFTGGTALFVQARRRRGGRCINCGYDRRGAPALSPCPECGRGEPGAVVVP
jgi:hypothetical protein